MGCVSTADPPTGDLRVDLLHHDPRVRMATAYLAAEEGRRDLLMGLVDNLGDRDESVRFITAIALRKLTGQDLGYRSYAPLGDREEAIARWRRWLAEPDGLPAEGYSCAPAGSPPPPRTASAGKSGERP